MRHVAGTDGRVRARLTVRKRKTDVCQMQPYQGFVPYGYIMIGGIFG
jgi:hypothetical protein